MDSPTKRIRRSSPEKRRYWQDHIEAQHRSGLSIGRYCRDQELAQSTFDYWRRKLASVPAPVRHGPSPVTIVPVPLQVLRSPEPAPASRRPFTLCLTVAERFHIAIGGDFSASVLEKLVATLERLA
jgi:hypothetical protein